MDPIRRHALTGLHGILQALPDDVDITVELTGLTRRRFDAIRHGEPEEYGRRSKSWFTTVDWGGVTVELHTFEPPVAQLRSVG